MESEIIPNSPLNCMCYCTVSTKDYINRNNIKRYDRLIILHHKSSNSCRQPLIISWTILTTLRTILTTLRTFLTTSRTFLTIWRKILTPLSDHLRSECRLARRFMVSPPLFLTLYLSWEIQLHQKIDQHQVMLC